MQRGDFAWRISVPADGHLPEGGVVPSLIQWDVGGHPTERLPDAGCRLLALVLQHVITSYSIHYTKLYDR